MKYNFDDIIKEKANSFEFEYDPKDWSKLNKKLGSSNPFSAKNLSIFGAAITLVAVTSVFTYSYFSANNIYKQVVNNPSIEKIDNITTENNKTKNTNTQFLEKNSAKVYTQKSDIKQNAPSNLTEEKINTQNVSSNYSSTENTNNAYKPTENKEFTKNNKEQISFSINQSAKEGCTPLSINFNSSNSIQNASYIWDFGDGNTAEGFNVSHNYTSGGIFKVNLIVKYENNTYTYHSNINAKETPTADFSWTNNDKNYSFKPAIADANTYEWKINNEVISTNDLLEKEFSKSDVYKVELTAKNSNGCFSTFNKPVKVEMEYFQIPNSFTPNGDGNNDFFGPIGEELVNLKYHFIIYDKSGAILFETDDPNKKWDGINYKTNKQATTTTDVFIWKVIIKDSSDKEQIKTGTVTIFVN
ncbi:MAG: PKD domain-containing protein [Bacteroidota bacterium]